MANEEKTNVEHQTRNMEDPKLAAIKEIIFGENIKEYDSEFKNLHKSIDKQNEELLNKLASLKSDLDKVINEMKENFSKQIIALKEDTAEKFNQLRAERIEGDKALGDMLIEVGKKLKSP